MDGLTFGGRSYEFDGPSWGRPRTSGPVLRGAKMHGRGLALAEFAFEAAEQLLEGNVPVPA